MRIYVFFTGVLLLISILANSQVPAGTIAGKVQDKNGLPLEYVSVALYRLPDSSLITGTITDNNGRYVLEVKRPGEFYVVADFMGYEKYVSETIKISSDKKFAPVNEITLHESSYGIDEVEVVTTEPLVSYKLDRKVVNVSRNLMAQGGTAVDALENVPSVQTDIEGNVTVRGSSNFTVLIDGRQTPLSGTDALNQIPASSIEQIEIITNPSVKYDPDGTAGIINIITKKNKKLNSSATINASIGTGPLYSFDGLYTYRKNKLTINTGLNYRKHIHDFKNNQTQQKDTSTNERFIETYGFGEHLHGGLGINTDFTYRITDKNTLSFGIKYSEFMHGHDNTIQNEVTSASDEKSYYITDNIDNMRVPFFQFQLGNKINFDGEKHYLETDLYYQINKHISDETMSMYNADSSWNRLEFTDTENEMQTRSNGNTTRLEIDYTRPLTEKMKMEAGYTFRNSVSFMNYSVFQRPTIDDDWNFNSEYSNKYDYSRLIQAAYILITGELGKLQYSAGLRGEYTNRKMLPESREKDYLYKRFDVYPSLSLTRNFNDKHTIQTTYSKRINRPREWFLNPFPFFSDGFNSFIGNPELEPEYVHSVELNYQLTFGQSFLSTELYFRKTNNSMERVSYLDTTDVLVRTMKNLEGDISTGIDVMANLKLAKWWLMDPSFTYYYYELNGTHDGEDIHKTDYSNRARLNNIFLLPTNTKIQLSGFYRGPRESVDGHRDAMYFMNFAVRQDLLKRKLSVTFKIDDVLDSRKMKSTSGSDYYYTESTRRRSGTIYSITLSYKFNPTYERRGRNGRNQENGDINGDDLMY